MPLNISWYDIPPSYIQRQRADGIKQPIARVALRPLTGEDQEAALRACRQEPLLLREKMVQRSLCGIAYADAEDKPGQNLQVDVGQSDPNLQPVNVYAALHVAILAMINLAFGDLNDGDSDAYADFRKSRKVTV